MVLSQGFQIKDGELQKTGRWRNKAYGSNGSDSILPTLWQTDEYESQIGSDIC